MSSAASAALASPHPRPKFSASILVAVVAIGNIAFHLLTAARYGYFIDEFYYYSCSEHLQWGYIDHPPLVAGFMWVTTHLFGTSVLGIRITPAILSGVLVWMVAMTARELGGGRFAQVLSALAVVAAPVLMLQYHFFSMNAVEPVIWTACTWMAIRAVRLANAHYWIAFGALCGLGMENKYSIALLIAGIVLGLLLTPARRALISPYFWLGMLAALLIFLPNLLWLAHNGYPFLQWRSVMAQRGEGMRLPTIRFLQHQLLWTGAACFVWLCGVAYFFFDREGRQYRFAAIAYVFVSSALIVLAGKTAYAAPVYGFLFAGGAVWLEQWTRNRAGLRLTMISVLAITGAILAPCFVPILPLDRVVAYQRRIPLPLPIQTESYAVQQKLPQVFSLETGWEAIVAEVADEYHHLPPARQARTGILAFHYGTAGAIDLLGPKYGLPKAISPAMTFHEWGPRNYNGESLILVGFLFPPSYCSTWREAPPVNNPYMYEHVGFTGSLIHVCGGLKFDLQKQWGGLPWY